MKISLSTPYLDDKETEAIKAVLKSGWLTEGPKNKEFEEKFAKFIGTKHAITLNSCASALFAVVKILNIKGEVILPSFTHMASANAIVTAGAKPVFADVEWKSCNIDPKDIQKKITKKTQAIMPVHFAGQSCQMLKIMALAKKYRLKIIEDSAEAIGAEYGGKKTGSYGTGCFSFFPTKNLTTGEGGMITTDDPVLAKKIRTLIAHGVATSAFERQKSEKPWLREAVLPGYNFRMSNVLAALGVEQLKKINRMNSLRRKHAKYLSSHLRKIKGIEVPFEENHSKHVYQMYTIKVNPKIRDALVINLRKKGIGASVHFDPPVHLQPFYKKTYGYKKGDLPVTEKLSSSIVTLPMYPGLTRKDLDFIIYEIRNYFYSRLQ